MKNISIVGSTGSIGKQTLEIAAEYPEKFKITGLSAFSDWETLLSQIIEFKPIKAAITNQNSFLLLKENLPANCNTEIIQGDSANNEIASMPETDISVISTVGISGLQPVIAALENGKEVALATKEALVTGGNLVMSLAKEKGITIRPIDSEHSAIFQCIKNETKYVSKIILTSSGGPFRTYSDLSNLGIEQVLAHPTWKMGKKITVDCATLMNKGFEVIEASFLFDINADDIEVVIHPQSIIHSMVEFSDACVLAQMSLPDMRFAISYALSMPERLKNPWEKLDLVKISSLTFEKPNTKMFPCLDFAYSALKMGKTFPTALNGANEEAVKAFLQGNLEFSKIPYVIEKVLSSHESLDDKKLENIIEADRVSVIKAKEIINANK